MRTWATWPRVASSKWVGGTWPSRSRGRRAAGPRCRPRRRFRTRPAVAGRRRAGTAGGGGAARAWDTAADLDELSRRPLVLVCSGTKAICDVGATLEALETRGVTVIGYRT